MRKAAVFVLVVVGAITTLSVWLVSQFSLPSEAVVRHHPDAFRELAGQP